MTKTEYIAFLDAFDDLVLRSEQLCALSKVLEDAAANPDHDGDAILNAYNLLSDLLDEQKASLTKMQKELISKEAF